MSRFMDARRIDENDLAVIASNNSLNAMTCRLRLIGNRRDLLADKPIKQRRFTGIRPTDKRNITAAKFGWFHWLEVSKGKAEREKFVLRTSFGSLDIDRRMS